MRNSVKPLLFVLALLTPAAAVGQEAEREILLGSVAMDIPAIMHKRLLPLTEYLAEAVGRKVTLRLSPNMRGAIEEISRGSVDIAYLTPVAYLRAREAGAQLVVKTVTQNKDSFNLMIVVREDSPIRTVEDLRGKRFAFGDRAAILQRAVVVGAGIPLEAFGEHLFIGHYDNIVRGVMNGDFDAGILKDTMAYDWQGKGIRILYTSPDLPPYNFSASRAVDADLVARLRDAFLALDPNNPAHLPVIHAVDVEYQGFAAGSDADYDIVRRLIQPFEAAR